MTGDMTFLGDGRMMVDIHDPADCEGRGCWVHHASDWPLNAAPVYWDETSGQAFRLCGHGALHRDLDDYEWATRFSGKWSGMPVWCCSDQAACGCCQSP
ncbi:MAG: hypothetical protein V9G04_19280 [Nocardioides sp.]